MKTFDFLIIGAGPAGLQFAYYLEKAGYKYAVLERADSAGSFFQKYPRHRHLISINKLYTGYDDPEINLRWDWNSLLSDDVNVRMDKYSKAYFPHADRLVDYLNDYANHFDLNIEYNAAVEMVTKEEERFIVKTKNGEVYQTNVLIVATGTSKPYIPNIEGVEQCDNYINCSVNPDDFINQRVLVIGKGNSGFELADKLISVASTIHVCSPNSLKFAWETHFVGHLRAVNNNLLDTYQLKSQNAVLDATISKIEKGEDGKFIATFHYAHANEEVETIAYDRIIVAAGFRFDHMIFDEAIRPELNHSDKFPKQTSEWESVNVKNLYFAGSLMQERDYKKSTSAFIHGFRYNIASLFNLMRYKYENIPIPSEEMEYTLDSFTERIMKRINRNSSLWQQFGFLGDLISVDPKDQTCRYYETVPVDYIHDTDQWRDEHQFILTMEYGKIDPEESIFMVNRIRRDEVDSSRESKFLHPVVRHYYRGALVSEHHMIEVLEARWEDEEMHIQPLREYLEEEMNLIQPPSKDKRGIAVKDFA
ncbi:MAG: NAD(P)-binding domain-containing protein [Bacteroidota bacterium]